MRKLLIAAAVVLVVLLASPMWAQLNDVYQVISYNTNVNPPEAIHVVNTGQQGSPMSSNHGTVCADVYVFDGNQEMAECCSCPITANGLLRLTLSAADQPLVGALLNSPLTGVTPADGVVKIVSDSSCKETSPTPVPGLRAWLLSVGAGPQVLREEFAQATLQPDEQQFLGQACAFVQYLGSGRGVCHCGLTR